MDIRTMQAQLQQFSSMLMRMMQQRQYMKESNAAWQERSLKQYAEQEAMAKRLQDYGLNKDISLAVAKSVIGGAKDMDRPGLESISRLGEAGMGSVPGVSLPQPTVQREEAIAPTVDSLRNIVKEFLPENLDMQEALTNLMMTKGSDEALGQMANYTKITEAEKEREIRKEEQKLTGRGLDLRAGELEHKKTGTEKVDKTIAKIEKARENRNDLMDKISSQTMDNFFESTTKSEKNVIKHILSLNGDIKRYKKEAKGYEDPDWKYAEAAKSVKNAGGTRQFLLKALMGGDLTPEEEAARETIKNYLNGLGLSLPVLMEYF